MDWNTIFSQFPILAICGAVALFLYGKIEKLQEQVILITKESITAMTQNTSVLNELKDLIHNINHVK
jgi:hypothetical protein